jgi:hypothetical protein
MTDLMTQLRDYGRQIESDPILSAKAPVVDLAPRSPQPRLGRGLAWAVAAFALIIAIGGFYLAFRGADGQMVDQTTVPTATTVLEPEPTAQEVMWPQSSLEEVEEAQELADAGDPDYTWQLEPRLEENVMTTAYLDDPEIFARFLREELGWEEFYRRPGPGFADGPFGPTIGLTYLRCAPGQSNPIYPDDPHGGSCAPTIDELRYETVEITVAQPSRKGSSGIWVVTGWETVEPVEQIVPLPDAEAIAIVEAFLQARIDGEGAEQYFGGGGGWAPLLYATSSGAPYERSEYELVSGPGWPNESMLFAVRLFADDGQTVVEQSFSVERDAAGRWGLENDQAAVENGRELLGLYDILGGEVTFSADDPWDGTLFGPSFESNGETADATLFHDAEGVVRVLADPLTGASGCEVGPAPADAAALAQSVRSNAEFETTAPVAVTIGGVPALQMDVMSAGEFLVCNGRPRLVVSRNELEPGHRMRLYLVDLPGGSAQILSIAIVAPKTSFDRVVESAEPILESIEFHAS